MRWLPLLLLAGCGALAPHLYTVGVSQSDTDARRGGPSSFETTTLYAEAGWIARALPVRMIAPRPVLEPEPTPAPAAEPQPEHDADPFAALSDAELEALGPVQGPDLPPAPVPPRPFWEDDTKVTTLIVTVIGALGLGGVEVHRRGKRKRHPKRSAKRDGET